MSTNRSIILMITIEAMLVLLAVMAESSSGRIKLSVARQKAICYNSRRLEEISFMNGQFKFTWYRYFGYFAQSGCAHA